MLFLPNPNADEDHANRLTCVSASTEIDWQQWVDVGIQARHRSHPYQDREMCKWEWSERAWSSRYCKDCGADYEGCPSYSSLQRRQTLSSLLTGSATFQYQMLLLSLFSYLWWCTWGWSYDIHDATNKIMHKCKLSYASKFHKFESLTMYQIYKIKLLTKNSRITVLYPFHTRKWAQLGTKWCERVTNQTELYQPSLLPLPCQDGLVQCSSVCSVNTLKLCPLWHMALWTRWLPAQKNALLIY